MNQLVLLRTAYGSESDAQAAAKRLVDARIAACAQVSKKWSTYRWQGRLEAHDEWFLEVTTLPDDQNAAWDALLDGHPYDTPCVEIVGTATVPARYFKWAQRATNRS